jgi:hypothetical protein
MIANDWDIEWDSQMRPRGRKLNVLKKFLVGDKNRISQKTTTTPRFLITKGGKVTKDGQVDNVRYDTFDHSFSTQFVILMHLRVPALPREENEPSLYATGLPSEGIRAMLPNPEWCA